MDGSLEIIVEVIAIVSFCATVINYIIIKPLRDSITQLTKAVELLDKLLTSVKEKQITLEGRVNVVERDIKHCFNRIEDCEKYHKH